MHDNLLLINTRYRTYNLQILFRDDGGSISSVGTTSSNDIIPGTIEDSFIISMLRGETKSP